MKRLMMKSGVVGIILSVGIGYSATNPCISDVSNYQLRTLGRAEAHQIGAVTGSELRGVMSNPAAQVDVYRLRANGRAEARQIPAATASDPALLADNGGVYGLRALGREEARHIGALKCEASSHQAPAIGQR